MNYVKKVIWHMFGFIFIIFSVQGTTINQLSQVYGDRNNQLIGYGLVVGLDGTGDKSQVRFTRQSIENMLTQFGVQLDGASSSTKNVAAVTVTASITPNKGPGQTLNVTVSSIGDANSLKGGTLLLTPLKGIDGQVYAIAQGNVIVGGYSYTDDNGSNVSENIATVGTIPNGATIEKMVAPLVNNSKKIRLQLHKPNYETAINISKKINETFGPSVAKALNKGQVEVVTPKDSEDRVLFLSMVQNLEVKEGESVPKVVYNSRSGTIVISKRVSVSAAAVSQGGISVTITSDNFVSQPNGFSETGETTVIQNSTLSVVEEDASMFIWPEGSSLQDIVDAVNKIGATPSELMQILQALDEAGALNAELIVI